MAHAPPSHPPPSAAPPAAHSAPPMPFLIRDFRPDDQPHVSRLYRDGLLTGQLDPFDPAADLERIQEVYVLRPPNRFWVAEADGRVIGTLAIAQEEPSVAHLRRLRVDPQWPDANPVVALLLQTATAYARSHGFLKIVLHTPVDDRRAVPLLRRFGLVFGRPRKLHGRKVLEFYLNLYRRPSQMDQVDLEDWQLL